ncbi:MAG: type II toxin-antitoxin system VapC family toxin [Calothrix sp. FI2-JRJ7]|nr:type II toxin-antitoxin system VapC family toxin [Calothrix sp. FI2-JRJ7]
MRALWLVFKRSKSDAIYQSLKAQRIRIGTQDLRIASIVLANNAILLTRNLQDFNKVPELIIQHRTI